MWRGDWRKSVWEKLSDQEEIWDLIIIGGGITGAGVFREAVRIGLNALLVEKNDFAWGTSSRSSKLVHGGFRYLKEGKIFLTRTSVQEREHLLDEAPGLIDPLGFLMVVNKGDFPGRWTLAVGLTVYDLLALRWDHRHYSLDDFQLLAPHVTGREMECGFRYGDAQTDDARLVLRLLQEGVGDGGQAINYVEAEDLLFGEGHDCLPEQVCGVVLKDILSGQKVPVNARLVVNATGVWADRLRAKVDAPARIRPLRGSHLVFPGWRLPVAQAVSFWHPIDRRPVFVFPWEGITLVGTTDVDHDQPLDDEPGISPEETAYLMAAVEAHFPSLNIGLDDILCTYSGVRPVIGSGKLDPSKESRDHVVWEEAGLLTVTGGKLTTFRKIALDVLNAARQRVPEMAALDDKTPVLNPVTLDSLTGSQSGISETIQRSPVLDEHVLRRLLGRFGSAAHSLLAAARPEELEFITGTPTLWAELRWASRAEGVVHLDDLLLRRVRIGLLLPQGGRALLPAVRTICQEELGWDDKRWQAEEERYLEQWNKHYCPPPAESVPPWKEILEEARVRRAAAIPARQRKIILGSSAGAALLLAMSFGFGYLIYRQFRRKSDS
jgi:glycerol-3-phosphate dehydrogenase